MPTPLAQLIRDRIRSDGPKSFAWFMEQALYHPEHGYYSTGRASIGRQGDFFTNVSVGPLFGRLMAAQFAEIWECLGKIDNFMVVEQGAHDGQFARDVLCAIQEQYPDFFQAVRYRIIEPFPVWQDRQLQTLEVFRDQVTWSTVLEPFMGVHFSNELIDAMPVNLRGKLVDLGGNGFVFIDGECAAGSAALDWIDSVARALQRGVLIAIDYGFARSEFHEVVRTRMQHRHLDSPFEHVGDADITAHINWTEIAERAETKGLRVTGFTDQHHFLTGIISKWPEVTQDSSLDFTALNRQVRVGEIGLKINRELQTLLHPEMLGRAFQVLALAKDVDLAARLAGFQFARDPRAVLGL